MRRLPPLKRILVWLVALAGIAFALPNVLSREEAAELPSWLPHRQVALGLDLQGGSHFMLRAARSDIVAERLETIANEVGKSLRDADIAYIGLSGEGQSIAFRVRDRSQLSAARERLRPLTAPVDIGGFGSEPISEVVFDSAEPDELVRLRLTDEGIDYRLSLAVAQSIDVVRRRVAEVGAIEPLIQRRGDDRLIVQVPGLGDPQRLKDLLSQRANLALRMLDTSVPVQRAVEGQPPSGTEVLYSFDDPPVPYLVEKAPLLAAANFVAAQPEPDASGESASVAIKIDTASQQRVAALAAQQPPKDAAIVLDGQVIATLKLSEAVNSDTLRISADLPTEGATDLAALVRTGPLATPLTFVEERTVGPGVGGDAIADGLKAGLVAAVAVAASMIFFYGVFGVFAVIALALNIVLIIAALSLSGATLTLPGIAGIILTIGVAVDSNVLIYERLREEVRGAEPLRRTINNAFSRVFSSIFDANLTMLIASAILFYLGSGSVRGFAVTLAIGSVTTLFTAYTVTRLIVKRWLRQWKSERLPKGIRTGRFSDLDIRFMRIRNPVFILMAALSLASVLLLAGIGLNLGVDFKGGSIIELHSKGGPVDVADLRARLDELNFGEVQVQQLGSGEDVLVRVPSQEAGDNAEQTAAGVIRSELSDEYDFRRVEVVGPVVSGELTRAGTIGLAVSFLAILLYVWLRFEWRFAVGAIIATTHDVLLTIGFLVLTGIEFNLGSIAAVLTIVGYSLNDTVVIYDRIRENLARYKRMPLSVLIDTSINQTLSRTILTALTTVLALTALYLFGGGLIRAFSVTMLFGVIVGTISSIYIAGPILILFRKRTDHIPGDENASGADTGAAGAAKGAV
ncbi:MULTISPECIES: protein translocase subunit SecDF [Ensifer]|uniref:Multifunctional fusion protein n=1 Tax=Ensifer adhaerens TaxID=106592 RepID=A0ABY8HJ41_ENSAD|nr:MULTISPECIES: protein translocase subunit SecDF [Ensifer]ANK72316.1 protein translocase subunit SecDF [Ensifer adhaerens]KDP74081.1 preprotein translocase subunit SecD/SecF [Ensifer adhaerens]KQX21026.1 preprotein translocase subunit SecD [Ensifer sp. Root423]KQZ41735.1 preprotein translocase subunit SecD [Ensifer sp. Root558]MBD9496008.1 protein translocase subunit SecDF [Ensifer sp. ENS01]